MDENMPNWDYDALSPFTGLALRVLQRPPEEPLHTASDAYLDVLTFGNDPSDQPLPRGSDPRLR